MSLETQTIAEAEKIMNTAITALKDIVAMKEYVSENRFTLAINRAIEGLSDIQMISEKFNFEKVTE